MTQDDIVSLLRDHILKTFNISPEDAEALSKDVEVSEFVKALREERAKLADMQARFKVLLSERFPNLKIIMEDIKQ